MSRDANVISLVDVVERLAKKSGLNKKKKHDRHLVAEMHNLSGQLFVEIVEALSSGKSVKIKNFGRFDVRQTQPFARNPGRNVTVPVIDRKRLRFLSSVNATKNLNKDK